MSEQDPFTGNTPLPPSDDQIDAFVELIDSIIPPESSVKFFNSANGKEYDFCVERPNPKVEDSAHTIEFTKTEIFTDYTEKTFTTYFLDPDNIVQRRVLTTREKRRPVHLIAEADQYIMSLRNARGLFNDEVGTVDLIKALAPKRTEEAKAQIHKRILDAVNFASNDQEVTTEATAQQLADAMLDVVSFLNTATAKE